MQQRAGRDERDVPAHRAHAGARNLGDLAGVEEQATEEGVMATRCAGRARELFAKYVVRKEEIHGAPKGAAHFRAPAVDLGPEFVCGLRDAGKEVFGGGTPERDHARRGGELELPPTLIGLDQSDYLHDVSCTHALHEGHLFLPDIRTHGAAGVAELEHDEGIAGLGGFVFAFAHEELVLHAVADGETGDVERGHRCSGKVPG